MVTTLTISVVWIVYSMIPPYLLIHYTWIGRGTTLQFMCRVAFVLSFVTSICAMLLLWAVYPKDYDFGAATKVGGPCHCRRAQASRVLHETLLVTEVTGSLMCCPHYLVAAWFVETALLLPVTSVFRCCHGVDTACLLAGWPGFLSGRDGGHFAHQPQQ